MSRDYCRYHPAKPSVWHCDHCHHDLCTECVPGSRENYDGATPACTLCNMPLTYLGAANVAEPFWQQAHRLFGYPLKSNGLVTLLFILFASALLPHNLLGVLGLVFLGAFTVHYGLNIIERVRDGNMTPPSLAEIFNERGEHLFLKQIAVLVLLGLFVAAAGMLGSLLGGLMLAFVLAAIPASTMLLATTRSVTDAVHPGNLAILMWRIGPSYALLWICLMVVAAGPTLVTPLLTQVLPQQAIFPAFMSVSSYFTFVTYAMMGYILYEKQAKLGFASNDDFGEMLEHKQFLIRRALAEARIFAAEGRHEQALDSLVKAIQVDESNAELREFYYRVVSATNDEEAIRRNTNSICEFFVLRRKLPHKAAIYCLETRKRFPDFIPNDSTACHLIAERWFEEGRYKDAAGLLLKLHKTAPEYPEMFAALLLMARIFFEGFNAPDKAKALLEQIRRKYPDHSEMHKVDRLIEVIGYTPVPSAG